MTDNSSINDSVELKELKLCLIDANKNLTGAQINHYASAILDAENKENYDLMNRLIQEALYNPSICETAA